MRALRCCLWAGLVLLTAGGCATAEVPMPSTLHVLGDAAPGDKVLLVLLPGLGTTRQDYLDEGFVERLRRSGLPFDLAVADAHIGYHMARNFKERLHHDVVLARRAAGYREVWLLGISMGGMGALLYARRYPGQVSRLVLMAPYLGDRPLLQRLAAAGSVRRWDGELSEGLSPEQVGWWRWLVGRVTAPEKGPQIWLGVGRDDRFQPACRLLGQELPPGRYAEVPGGHDWPAWRALLERFVARWQAERGLAGAAGRAHRGTGAPSANPRPEPR